MRRRFTHILCSLALLLSPLLAEAATISPSVIDVSGAREQVVDSSFTILNTGASEQVYFLDVIGFQAGEEDGSPSFTPEATSPLLSWIALPSSDVTVPALSKVDVPFKLVIPDDIVSGSYQGAITVSTAPSDVVAQNGATIEARTAILVFLVVEGETIEKLELLDFTFEQTHPRLPFGTFSFRVQNQGNVHLVPNGSIVLSGLFGKTLATIHVNETAGRVLPDSTRTYSAEFLAEDLNWFEMAGFQLQHLAIGSVTATLDLGYGASGVISSSFSFILIPIELLSVLLLMLVGIGLLYKKLASR
jgi:hypothetical protein